MIAISILVPSRLQASADGRGEQLFLQDAIESIYRQTLIVSGAIQPQIIVGIDAGADMPTSLAERLGIAFAMSERRSQAGALNAAATRIEGDYVAILEDDDQWEPEFLEIALTALQSASFVSSSQLELDSMGRLRRVVDYPTPSGWVMRRDVWESIGCFNEDYRWHLDAEWLGRLNEEGVARIHLVEANAPEPDALKRVTIADRLLGRGKAKRARQGLLRVAEASASVKISRHRFCRPLVTKQFHESSGHALISAEREFLQQSDDEKARLVRRFGSIPW
jgi:glycosyltransferase involved in cell wall biosynthesis